MTEWNTSRVADPSLHRQMVNAVWVEAAAPVENQEDLLADLFSKLAEWQQEILDLLVLLGQNPYQLAETLLVTNQLFEKVTGNILEQVNHSLEKDLPFVCNPDSLVMHLMAFIHSCDLKESSFKKILRILGEIIEHRLTISERFNENLEPYIKKIPQQNLRLIGRSVTPEQLMIPVRLLKLKYTLIELIKKGELAVEEDSEAHKKRS